MSLPETSFVFTTRLPDTCPSHGQNIIKHFNNNYSETSIVQCQIELNRSFDGLPTHLACRWCLVLDSLVVNTKDISVSSNKSGSRSGIYLYYNGSATGKSGEIVVVIPKKIDLSHFFVEDSIDEEIFTFAPEAQNRKPEVDSDGSDRNVTEDFTVSSEIRFDDPSAFIFRRAG